MSLILGKNNIDIPAKTDEGTLRVARSSRFGELIIDSRSNGLDVVALEGGHFRAIEGPGVSSTSVNNPSAYAVNSPSLILRNASVNSYDRTMYMNYIRFMLFTTGIVSGLGIQFAVTTDSSNRYTSGGSNLTNIKNSSTNTTAGSSVADIRYGAMTCAAASGAFQVQSFGGLGGTGTPTIGNVYTVYFGEQQFSPALSGVVHVGPVVLLPNINASLFFHLWGWTSSPQIVWEAAWWERRERA